jgi:hypothetical protein
LLFSKTWADACNEESEAKPFWIDFFEIFGITNKLVESPRVFRMKGTLTELAWAPDASPIIPPHALPHPLFLPPLPLRHAGQAGFVGQRFGL